MEWRNQRAWFSRILKREFNEVTQVKRTFLQLVATV